MSHTKFFSNYHLIESGWVAVEEHSAVAERSKAPANCLLSLQFIEYDFDSIAPTSQFQTRILRVSEKREKVKELLSVFGLPKSVTKNCPTVLEELRQCLESAHQPGTNKSAG